MNRWDTLVLGIDPGQRHMGLAARLGDQLLGHDVVQITASGRDTVDGAIVREAMGRAAALLDRAEVRSTGHRQVLIAVEGVEEPKGFKGGKRDPINLRGLIGAATVHGGALTYPWPGHPLVVTVRPGGNGSGVLATYPPALITAAERRQGLLRPAGQSAGIRHARSAWDVAGAAPMLARTVTA